MALLERRLLLVVAHDADVGNRVPKTVEQAHCNRHVDVLAPLEHIVRQVVVKLTEHVGQKPRAAFRQGERVIGVEAAGRPNGPQVDQAGEVSALQRARAQVGQGMGLSGSTPPVEDLMVARAQQGEERPDVHERLDKRRRVIRFGPSVQLHQRGVRDTRHSVGKVLRASAETTRVVTPGNALICGGARSQEWLAL